MKRLVICGACLSTIVAVCASVAMAIGIELVQKSRVHDG